MDIERRQIMIWKLTDSKEWNALEKQFSWVEDMQYVNQHRVHHAEGNVAIHTQMVIEELLRLPNYQGLNDQDREILWTVALMHDIEKRSTSENEGNGIIHAPGHAKRGEHTVREILFKDVETPFFIREHITSLVRLHGLPLWLMEKKDSQKKVIEASLRLNTIYLKMIAEADARGRICEDLHSLLYSLDLYELYCKEQRCWGSERPFQSLNTRYKYFSSEDSFVDYVPFDNFRSKVILLSGLPGMGKDYYIQSLNKDIPVVSLDEIRRKNRISPTDKKRNGWVVQEAKEQARTYLRQGQDFIWNATNITTLMRKQLVDLFVDYGAFVSIHYIEKPYKIWRYQNSNREYPLPENILNKMFQSLEIPQQTEAHEVTYVV